MITPGMDEDDIINKEKLIIPEKEYTLKQKFFAELIGTAFLVFIVTGISLIQYSEFYTYININSMSSSFVLTSMIYIFGKVSGGHFNPAVSIPMALRGKITFKELAYYLIAQILGAFLGSGFLALCLSGDFEGIQYGANDFENNLKKSKVFRYISSFFCEMILTFIFVLVIFGSTIKENNYGNLTGFIIGITLYFLCITGGSVSGGSLNPARSISPAVIQAIFFGKYLSLKHLWVYILGPISGGIIACYASKIFE